VKKTIARIQIASFSAEKFEIPFQRAAEILDDVIGLAVFESKRAKSFTFPGISKLVIYRRPKMAKKPMTKSQIVSYFAGKFELTKKTATGIIDEVAALVISQTPKSRLLYPSGSGKWKALN
jgi:hypothetical protein